MTIESDEAHEELRQQHAALSAEVAHLRDRCGRTDAVVEAFRNIITAWGAFKPVGDDSAWINLSAALNNACALGAHDGERP